MIAISKYKPVITMVLLMAVIFSIFGVGALYADDIHEVTDDDDSSILGSFFHFVGAVVAFPFKVIGKVFDGIF